VLLPINWLAKRIYDKHIEIPEAQLMKLRSALNEKILSLQDNEFGQWMWALDVSGINNSLLLFNDIVRGML
jgi:hypothetical protein